MWHSNDRGRDVLGVAFLVSMSTIFVAITTHYYIGTSDYFDSDSYKIAIARVQKAEIHRSGTSSRDSGCNLDLRYSYQVAGVKYVGTRLQFNSGVNHFESSASAKLVKRRYRVGRAIEIFYDPAHPDRSVVKREIDIAAVGSLIFLSLLSGFLIVATVVTIKSIITTAAELRAASKVEQTA